MKNFQRILHAISTRNETPRVTQQAGITDETTHLLRANSAPSLLEETSKAISVSVSFENVIFQ
jgi:hypothetical protein